MTELKCTTYLSDDQAHALAQLSKRIGWTELRSLASSDEEAQWMREAIYQLRQSLAEIGFAPR